MPETNIATNAQRQKLPPLHLKNILNEFPIDKLIAMRTNLDQLLIKHEHLDENVLRALAELVPHFRHETYQGYNKRSAAGEFLSQFLADLSAPAGAAAGLRSLLGVQIKKVWVSIVFVIGLMTLILISARIKTGSMWRNQKEKVVTFRLGSFKVEVLHALHHKYQQEEAAKLTEALNLYYDLTEQPRIRVEGIITNDSNALKNTVFDKLQKYYQMAVARRDLTETTAGPLFEKLNTLLTQLQFKPVTSTPIEVQVESKQIASEKLPVETSPETEPLLKEEGVLHGEQQYGGQPTVEQTNKFLIFLQSPNNPATSAVRWPRLRNAANYILDRWVKFMIFFYTIAGILGALAGIDMIVNSIHGTEVVTPLFSSAWGEAVSLIFIFGVAVGLSGLGLYAYNREVSRGNLDNVVAAAINKNELLIEQNRNELDLINELVNTLKMIKIANDSTKDEKNAGTMKMSFGIIAKQLQEQEKNTTESKKTKIPTEEKPVVISLTTMEPPESQQSKSEEEKPKEKDKDEGLAFEPSKEEDIKFQLKSGQ